MYILAIETTGPYGSAAIIGQDGQVKAFADSRNNLSHLKDLIPMVGQVIEEAGIARSDISVIAPSVGPGSFTGIRIGVSTARALAQAFGIRCIAVPTLDAFTFKSQVQEAKEAGMESGRQVVSCAILNARRGQVYGMVEGCMEAGPYMLTDVLQVITEKVLPEGRNVLFMGDGVDAYAAKIEEALAEYEERFAYAGEAFRYQDAAAVGKWAWAQIEAKGFENCTVSVEELLPEYMRKAEAEQKLEAGELPICKGPKQE